MSHWSFFYLFQEFSMTSEFFFNRNSGEFKPIHEITFLGKQRWMKENMVRFSISKKSLKMSQKLLNFPGEESFSSALKRIFFYFSSTSSIRNRNYYFFWLSSMTFKEVWCRKPEINFSLRLKLKKLLSPVSLVSWHLNFKMPR